MNMFTLVTAHFSPTKEQARLIIKERASCVKVIIMPLLSYAVTSWVQLSNHIWHMDITHILTLGNWKYVHAIADNYSLVMFALPLSGEAVKDAIIFLLGVFAILDPVKIFEADSSPPFHEFCQFHVVSHIIGIPYNLQGQSFGERVNGQLKCYLEIKKQEKGSIATPHNIDFLFYLHENF